jgi:hypothetical protein
MITNLSIFIRSDIPLFIDLSIIRIVESAQIFAIESSEIVVNRFNGLKVLSTYIVLNTHQ